VKFFYRKSQRFITMDEDIDALLEAAFDKKGVSESVMRVCPV
jgi:hypothetical protein